MTKPQTLSERLTAHLDPTFLARGQRIASDAIEVACAEFLGSLGTNSGEAIGAVAKAAFLAGVHYAFDDVAKSGARSVPELVALAAVSALGAKVLAAEGVADLAVLMEEEGGRA